MGFPVTIGFARLATQSETPDHPKPEIPWLNRMEVDVIHALGGFT